MLLVSYLHFARTCIAARERHNLNNYGTRSGNLQTLEGIVGAQTRYAAASTARVIRNMIVYE
jgi:hypothetical protein